MARLTKEQLVRTGQIGTEECELPDGSGSVLIRGLTRSEAIRVAKEGGDDSEVMERLGMVAGLVDPEMTADEVAEWQANGLAANVAAVAGRIAELSNVDAKGGKGPTSSSRRTRS